MTNSDLKPCAMCHPGPCWCGADDSCEPRTSRADDAASSLIAYAAVGIVAALIGALIALTVMTGFSRPAAAESVPAKSDRIAEAFALVSACSTAAWPKVPAECVEPPEGVAGYRVPTRTVTVEERDEANRTSILIRVPAATASR